MQTGNILNQCFSDSEILAAAAAVMEKRMNYGTVFDSPQVVKDFIRFRIGAEEREHFMVVFLDAQNRCIEADVMFSGTVSQTSVYPREIVKRALSLNAVSVILAHNHPSGAVEPSSSDISLTDVVKTALKTVDIRVLDHIIVGATRASSFAEKGLL